jgi:hypothetical protein
MTVTGNSSYARKVDVRGKKSVTMSRAESPDEQLLRRLLAPPGLDDGVRSLDYWRRRSRQLPWYQIRERREAMRMTTRWEDRVGAALVSHRAPLEARVSAGLLLGRTRLSRWVRRVRIAALTAVTTVIVLVAVPAAVALVSLLHAL